MSSKKVQVENNGATYGVSDIVSPKLSEAKLSKPAKFQSLKTSSLNLSSLNKTSRRKKFTETPDIVCLSHLRWNFVYQRPQHILSRCAQGKRVFFIEEPIFSQEPSGRLNVSQDDSGVVVVVPHLPEGLSEKAINADLQVLINGLFVEHNINKYICWYYTPMAIAWTRHLQPQAVIYDYMDELSPFKGASPTLKNYEAELFCRADLVFTDLEQISWDWTWGSMMQLIESAIASTQDATVNGTNGKSHISTNILEAPSIITREFLFDYLVVGAGFSGSVLAERLAKHSGKKVLVVDKRNHIGGNAYDHYDDQGILVHKYGPHIFHTNSCEVFEYLSQFTPWRAYEHHVLASVDGQLVPIPINLDTINKLYGMNLNSFQAEEFFQSVAEPREHIRTSEDVVVSKVGQVLYEKFFRNYTRKQWGLDPSELDKTVIARIPTRTNRDSRYFTDSYQAMPLHGFTRMFENMLNHPNIKLMLNTDYREIQKGIPCREIVYTGPVDEFFDYRYGKLPYRSLDFKHETHHTPVFQSAPVINYPNEQLYTRVTEFKYLTGQEHSKTSIVYEFPKAEGDPYYPVPRPENQEIYKQYKALADEKPGIHFVGRLATYKYLNMDHCVAQALATYKQIAVKA
ncbi:MAG: UDP-galactopyranose mutase [Nostoc sp.]|uniref:UDP-galactopyranose mutase n=1 Tax=Nostoc sp. TaxID=1180 RepID=UPI002FF23FA7